MSKEEKIALDGWPKLGSDTRAQIRIKESSTFRVKTKIFYFWKFFDKVP